MICKSFEVVLEELNIGHELPWCDSPWRNIQIYQSTVFAFTKAYPDKEAGNKHCLRCAENSRADQ